MEFRLLGAAAIAGVAARIVVWFEGRRDRDDPHPARAWEALVLSGIIGLVAGRLTAMISGGVNPVTHPLDLLIVRGGVDTAAASLGALGALVVTARRDLVAVADAAAPAAVGGLTGWHAACLVRDACAGTASGMPWAISGPAGIGRHPVEIYAALLLAAFTAALVVAWRRRARPGLVAGLGLAAAAGTRLLTEPMRLGIGPGPVWWYAGGVVAGASIALAAWATGRRRA